MSKSFGLFGSSAPAPAAAPAAAPPARGSSLTDRIKGFARNATDAVTAYTSSPADEASKHGKVVTKLFNVKRRVEEGLLEALAVTHASRDDAYEGRREAFEVMEEQLKSFRKHVCAHIDASRAACFAMASLGEDVRTLFQGSGDPTVATYADQMSAFDTRLRAAMDTRVCECVITRIDARLAEIADVHKAMRERALLKLDMDARARKVGGLKEGGSGGDPAKLASKEAKLTHTRTLLEDATAALYARMDALEAARYAFTSEVLAEFSAAQRAYFTEGASMCASLPVITHTHTHTHAAPPMYTVLAEARAAAVPGEAPASRPLPTPGPAAAKAPAASRARVTHAYTRTREDELTLAVDEIVTVVEKHADGWWSGARESEPAHVGVFPSNFVTPIA